MAIDVLKTVGQVAGIGGLGLGVCLIIFREVIRKNIFPNLTKEQGYKLLRMLVVLTFALGVIGIGAWVYVESKPRTEAAPALLAEFVLDEKGGPRLIEPAEDGHYMIRFFVRDVPPDVTSVVYQPFHESFGGKTYSSDARPEFKTGQSQFDSYGNDLIIFTLKRPGGDSVHRDILADALERHYTGDKMTPPIAEAIAEIKKY